jgi:RecB family endonuclease NucS
MPIYEKPTKVLMHEFAKEQLKPGQIFERRDAVDWFAKRYPNIRPTTVQMHVEGMSINSSDRKHHPNIKPGSGHDLFFKVARGKYRLWNKEVDPAPNYLNGYSDFALPESAIEEESVDEAEVESSSDAFAYERDLRNYLAKNLHVVEPGLKIYEEEDFNGIEYPVGGRYIDILAIDAKGEFVVMELKVSRGYDRTAGQLLRYMAWVKKNLAGGKKVRGLIVAREISEDLKLAVSMISDVQLIEYELSFKLCPLEQ